MTVLLEPGFYARRLLALIESIGSKPIHFLHPKDEAPFRLRLQRFTETANSLEITTEDLFEGVVGIWHAVQARLITINTFDEVILRTVAEAAWDDWLSKVTEEEWNIGLAGLLKAKKRFEASQPESTEPPPARNGW